MLLTRLVAGALALVCLFAAPAEARHRAHHKPAPVACTLTSGGGGWFVPQTCARRFDKARQMNAAAFRRQAAARTAPGSVRGSHGTPAIAAVPVFDNDGRAWLPEGAPPAPAASPIGVARAVVRSLAGAIGRATASLAGLPGPLVDKVEELASACGMRPISTFRPGARIAGTNVRSLHGFHKAADIAGGNYGCAYARLASWPGGVSTDPEVVHHIHLSWDPGSREWGARFRHGGWHHRSRYARPGRPAGA
jgi:hypothetical protein